MPTNKSFLAAIKKPQVTNALEDQVLELYFFDEIQDIECYDWMCDETVEVSLVQQVVQQVKCYTPSRIKVYIDSEGGDAGIGLAIYNFLRSYNAKVEVEIIGMACSIASVIAMAASKGKLVMARNAFMVIHKASGVGIGNSEDLRAMADVVDKYTQQCVDIYCQRTGKTADEINGMMAKGDYWMTGQEALDLGFCDSLINDNPQFQVAARVKKISNSFKNVPESLVTPETTPEPTFHNYIKNEVMEIKLLVSNFIKGLTTPTKAEGATEPAVVTNEVKAFAASIEKPLNDFLENAQKEINTEVQNKINESLPKVEAFTALQRKVDDLVEENKNLAEEVKNKLGAQSAETTDSKQGAPAVIGKFS